MSDSPTRIAEIPAASSRSTSARVRMPLSLTSTTSEGIRSRSRKVCSRSVWKSVEVAVVDPDQIGA